MSGQSLCGFREELVLEDVGLGGLWQEERGRVQPAFLIEEFRNWDGLMIGVELGLPCSEGFVHVSKFILSHFFFKNPVNKKYFYLDLYFQGISSRKRTHDDVLELLQTSVLIRADLHFRPITVSLSERYGGFVTVGYCLKDW